MTAPSDDREAQGLVYLYLWMGYRLLRNADDAALEAAGTNRDQLAGVIAAVETRLLPPCFEADTKATVLMIERLAMITCEHQGKPS